MMDESKLDSEAPTAVKGNKNKGNQGEQATKRRDERAKNTEHEMFGSAIIITAITIIIITDQSHS